ncbi:MAG TPA: aromatic ring-hydroxylating dioxygenase subunit alpha [Xanthobacteraceae bacterium]|jgi:phenylpropionate dioxygenase-like ring-hydroxylating dioxygenase large terminal subunit
MFVNNAWYVAGWDREVTATPRPRMFLNQPVVLYRTAEGKAVALEDRCCHRHYPLSRGKVIGESIQCGYHGLRFDGTGACVEIPGQDMIPRNAKVRSYPITEKYGWVWIWMGDPARADLALIPNWWWCEHKDWAFTKPDMLHINCNYELVTDNLLDVTHLAYVHATSIGTSAITEFPIKVEREENRVRMTRWVIDRPAPPMYQAAGQFPGNADRGQLVEFQPPAFTVNFAQVADTGTGAPQGKPGNRRIDLMALSAPTPETDKTTHYFFGFVRNFALEDPKLEEMMGVGFVNVFKEDVAVLDAQQHTMDLMPNAPEIDIKVDGPPKLARLIVSRWRAAERGDVPAKAAMVTAAE